MADGLNLSLMEQLRISERDIVSRQALFHMSADDCDLLANSKELIVRQLDFIVDRFYQEQTQNREIALLIGDRETLSRLKQAQRHYIVDLFSGVYDAAYVNSRLRVGKVHKRIGVTPMLYMAAVHSLLSLLNESLEEGIKDPNVLLATQRSLLKLMMFDVELIFETYIASMMSEVESARQEVEAYADGLTVEVAERTRQLEEISKRDSLTGLYNQRAFYEELRLAMATAERSRTPLSIAYMDLNGFKAVNDRHGHAKGDDILQCVGGLMSSAFRDGDVVARYGGDEFCAIMPNAAMDEARKACERLIAAADKQDLSGVTIAVGISELSPGSLMSSEDLLCDADKAMYQAKERSHQTPTVRGLPSSQIQCAS